MREKQSGPLASQFGARVRLLRMERSLTQTKLEEQVGLRRGRVEAIERGLHASSIHELQRLANALQVNPFDLLNDPTTDAGDIVDMTRQWHPRTVRRFVALLQGQTGRVVHSRSSRPKLVTKHKRRPSRAPSVPSVAPLPLSSSSRPEKVFSDH